MLNNISGKIQKNGTNTGIQNIMVVFYDVDISTIKGDPTKGFENQYSINPYIKFLYGLEDSEEDKLIPGQPTGDRLGSTITDSNGYFSIQFDDDAFRIGDNEQRPDLLLLVVAPDQPLDNTDQTTFPTGTPEVMRLLHISLFPARNIGREEEFIIGISETTLERYNLVTSVTQTPESFAAAVAAPANRKTQIRTELRKKLSIDKKIEVNREYVAQAEAFASRVSAVPKALRKDDFFVGGSNNSSEVIERVQEKGLETLKKYSAPSLRPPSARLRFSAKELKKMGLSSAARVELEEAIRNGESLEIEMSAEVFCAALHDRIGGTTLERVTSLLSSDRQELSDRLDGLENPSGEEIEVCPPESSGEDTEGVSAEEQIKQLVLAQVASLEAQDSSLEEDEQSARVLKNLQKLKPPASPADVTAFHDFTHLQIAFPDVWTEAFDRDVSEIIRQMHIEYKEIDEEYRAETGTSVFGEDVLDIDPDELLDLEEYSDLMRKLGADLLSVGNASEPPPIVENFYSPLVLLYTENRESRKQQLLDAWPSLSLDQQNEIYELAITIKTLFDSESSNDDTRADTLFNAIQSNLNIDGLSSAVDLFTHLNDEKGESNQNTEIIGVIARVEQIVANPAGRVSRVQHLIEDLARRLSEPHSFRVFEKNSVNFGILTTYRQEWVPGSYQVGDLVGTLPLAPGQTQKYTKKESTKKTRSQKENEKYASTIQDERQITSRAVSDIVDKASTATNFQQTVGTQSGGKLFGFNVNINTSTQFQRNQAAESQRIKKDFREAVRKSSQEFKNERSIEVSTEDVFDSEFSSKDEISNPNNEITVTYLFYELERQYRVTEHLQRLTPVIMVAQEVPNPSEIDEDWLLAHEWILRRSLLDDSFNDALDYISEGLVADEVNLETRRDTYETQKALVEELSDNVETLNSLQNTLRDTLVQTSEREKLAQVARKRAKKRRRRGFFKKLFLPVPGIAGKLASGSSSLGFGRRGEDPEALEARREALETRLKFLEGNIEDGRAQLTRASSALENATEELTVAVEKSFTERNLVNQLRLHVKDNILHYMQMIWSYEQPDQRFFRLYGKEVKVPVTSGTAKFEFISPENDEAAAYLFAQIFASLGEGSIDAGVRLPPPEEWTEKRRLHEIADLDKPLGFKGNYMLFPLKECVYLTDYMMQDYIDDYLGIRDPDPMAGATTDELLRHAETIWHRDGTTEEQKKAIKAVIQSRLTSPRLEDELIVVPTGQLFIEALKGEHALLEGFKRQHRGLDVLKVNEEVRAAQLENLRKAARLVGNDPDLNDPDIDQLIHVEGSSDISVDT